jgi:hypothetical protein
LATGCGWQATNDGAAMIEIDRHATWFVPVIMFTNLPIAATILDGVIHWATD